MRESVGQLGALLHDYGSAAGQGAAAEELSRALATGLIGGALHQYLTSTLGGCAVPCCELQCMLARKGCLGVVAGLTAGAICMPLRTRQECDCWRSITLP